MKLFHVKTPCRVRVLTCGTVAAGPRFVGILDEDAASARQLPGWAAASTWATAQPTLSGAMRLKVHLFHPIAGFVVYFSRRYLIFSLYLGLIHAK